MDKTVKISILDDIVKRINRDQKGMSRFLKANSYTIMNNDYFTFDGVITQDVFLNYLYYEDDEVKNKKEELFHSLLNAGGKNTIVNAD